ncbi:MAG: class I SAM-dependent methyltransferase [Flavobacteriaceae bacterium]|nr:class I SAM-dependent methyltransferase [Flavobacteriaceae bacterium]MCY4267691.1 class I SAM-dependent methyltransferase [Flavobacteriaceae bacterium]MCY4299079.1 class I SAM-dependent methyltransferase [Flavobacteriaceae bacterium]
MKHHQSKLLYQVKDHAQSQKTFNIYWNHERTIAQTDVEHIENMEDYYSSDYMSFHSKTLSLHNKLYGVIRQWMHHRKWKLITSHFKKKNLKVLDFGAGGGYFADFLKKRVETVDLIESNHRAVSQCLEKGHRVFKKLKELPGNETYQVMTMWHVLEHLNNPKETIRRMKEYLEENGVLVIAVPNIQSFDAQKYKACWAAWDVPRHRWHFTPQGLIGLLKEAEFQILQKRTLFFDGFYISQLSEKNKGSQFWFIKGLFWGAASYVWGLMSGNYSTMVLVARLHQRSPKE